MTDIFKLIIAIVVAVAIAYVVYLWFSKKTEGFEESCNKNYFLDLYYVEWCPYCKTFLPIFNSVGSTLTIGDKVVEVKAFEVEKIKESGGKPWENLRANKDRIPVNGYPTVRLYNPEGEMIAEFDGMRTKDGILDFLHRNEKLKN
jgi:thiol-disulfide isomerase/thioredoxin